MTNQTQKYFIVAFFSAMLLTISSPAQAFDDFFVDLLGRGAGAALGAQLCDDGDTARVACGIVGAELGSKVTDMWKTPDRQYYGRQIGPSYQRIPEKSYRASYNNHDARRPPRRDHPGNHRQARPLQFTNCQTVLLSDQFGRIDRQKACQGSNGDWIFINSK